LVMWSPTGFAVFWSWTPMPLVPTINTLLVMVTLDAPVTNMPTAAFRMVKFFIVAPVKLAAVIAVPLPPTVKMVRAVSRPVSTETPGSKLNAPLYVPASTVMTNVLAVFAVNMLFAALIAAVIVV